MRRALTAFLITFLTTGLAWGQTLGQATEQSLEQTESLISSLQEPNSTWGEETALDDMNQLKRALVAMQAALEEESDAAQLDIQVSDLKAASRRAETSSVLLPSTQAKNDLEAILAEIRDLCERLDSIRGRFGTKASRFETPLAEVELQVSLEGLDLYRNQEALLIDIRDLRRLVSSLQVGGFPQQGIGFGQPNNLEGLQVRRLVLATWELERNLSGQLEDITEVMRSWHKTDQEYRRLGYPGNSEVVRQMERVMSRLETFFAAVGNPQG